MDPITTISGLHEYLTVDRVLLLYFVYNTAVQALPEPNGSKLYRFFYGFAHGLAGNTNVVRKNTSGARFHQDQHSPG